MADVVPENDDILIVALVFVSGATEPYAGGSSIGVDRSWVSHSRSLFVYFFVGVNHEHPRHWFHQYFWSSFALH